MDKKITITKARTLLVSGKTKCFEAVGGNDMEASDGYHTFKELYEHRITLFIALCKRLRANELIDKANELKKEAEKF